MRAPRIARNHVVTLVAGILIGLLLIGSAVAVTSSSFKYSQTQTGYLRLSPMDFAPDSLLGATSDYFNSWSGGRLSNDDTSRCFNTGVNLPQGAKLKKVTYYYQSDATSDFFGEVVRSDPVADTTQVFAVVSPIDDTDVAASVTANVPTNRKTVNNQRYAYAVGVCPNLGTDFRGVRIQYTYTTAGD